MPDDTRYCRFIRLVSKHHDDCQLMRVLCVTSGRGAITNVRPEAETFIGVRQLGAQVTVMTQRDSCYVSRMEAAGIEVLELETRCRLDPVAIRRIRATLKTGGYQILHAFNNKAITNGIVAVLGLPVRLVTYRGQTGNIHRYDPTAYLTHLNPRVDCVVCVADSVRLDLIANGLPASKAATIYKGHSLAWYQAPPVSLGELGIRWNSMVVGLVANARPRKGIPLFLRALRQLPDDVCCDILLVGAGMEVYKEAAIGLPKQVRIHFMGYRTDAAEVIAACRVSVLPALRREGLPKATIEAMAYGVTPLVTRTGGNAELVVDGESGLVVEPGNETALAEALTWLYRNPARCVEMGQNARERIDQHFNIKDTVGRTFDLYQSLLR